MPEVETQKVYSVAEQKWIEKPVEGAAAPAEEPTDDPVDPPTPDPNDPPQPEKKEEEEPEKKAEDSPELEPEKKEEQEKKEEPEKKEELEPTFDLNTSIKSKWGEKYGIENEEELDEILSAQDELLEEFNKLKSKANEPKWRSEQEQKIAEFLQPYDPSRFEEGLNTAATIMGMDVEKASSERVLKEKYVLDHPHLTRDEALELWQDQYDAKYALNREDFDDDAAFEKRKKILDIQRKNEDAQARKELKSKQEALKAAPEKKEDPEKKTEPEKSTIPEETIQDYHSQIDKFFNPSKDKSFDRFQYLDDDGKTVLFNLKLDKEKLSEMKDFMKKYVQSEGLYDKNGKIPNFTAEQAAKIALRVLHGDWLEDQLWSQVKTIARTIKAEQIAGKSPEKKSGGKGEQLLSPIEQFRKQAQKKVAGG